ncbi:MAG: hypothetical protein ABL907_13670 [Hyphomicrobium sp.]
MASIPIEQALGWRTPLANVTYGSASLFRVQLNATTRVVLEGNFVNPNGGGAYTGSYSAPQFGTISKMTIETLTGINGTVVGRETMTGAFPRLESIFNDVIYLISAGRGGNVWNPDIPTFPPALDFISSTRIAFANTDGATHTIIDGFGFTFSPSGSINGGTATHIGRLDNAIDIASAPPLVTGGSFYNYEHLHITEFGGAVNVPLLKVWNGLFDVTAQQEFFAKLFSGVTSYAATGNVSAANSPFDDYLKPLAITGDDANDVVSGGLAGDVMHGGGGNDVLKGLLGNDWLFGDAGNDVLHGGLGNDRLLGGAGIDTMNGGAGNDAYYLDHAGEVIIEGGGLGGGFDWVYIPVSVSLAATAGNRSVENASLTGVAAANLAGNTLNNVLTGNAAHNILTGGLGRDTLSGKAGADTFDFNAPGETGKTAATRDYITDFTSSDVIDLSTIDANGARAELGTFAWRGAAGFTGVAGQLHYTLVNSANNALDRTIIEGDLNGDRVADFQIELKGLFALTASPVLTTTADIIL